MSPEETNVSHARVRWYREPGRRAQPSQFQCPISISPSQPARWSLSVQLITFHVMGFSHSRTHAFPPHCRGKRVALRPRRNAIRSHYSQSDIGSQDLTMKSMCLFGAMTTNCLTRFCETLLAHYWQVTINLYRILRRYNKGRCSTNL